MFKFGFSSTDTEQEDDNKSAEKQWYSAEEIIPQITKYNLDKDCNVQQLTCQNIVLKYVSIVNIINYLKENESESSNVILLAETNHSDLITAKYEGGLKIWECTIDLISYLNDQDIDFTNKHVLDLGCGAGMLGVYTLLKNSITDFQDYNKEVIELTTIPNVLLNISNSDQIKLGNCKFYSGDWKSFSNLTNSKYDYILTSETIYNPENYEKLLDLFFKLIKDDGIIYLAAKAYYFGVGGSTREFEQYLNKNGHFTISVCWIQKEGIQREILKIQKK